MKINLPHCEHMVQVLVSSPDGECVKMFDSSHKSFEMELPDGVHEDEVEVLMVRLDERGLAIGEMSYLKEAVEEVDESEPESESEPEPEPEDEDNEDNEDAPVEADEEADESPPDEVADEQVDEEELDEDGLDAADSRYGQGYS